MSVEIRVYVDGTGVSLPSGATALDAVRQRDSALAEAVLAGTRAITDSRGLPAAIDTPVFGGAIFRVVSTRAAVAASDDSPD